MNADAEPAAKDIGFFSRASGGYEKVTGESVSAWIVLAIANFAVQVIFFREMTSGETSAGEFGLLTAALGIVGFLTVPLLAVRQAFLLYPVRPEATGAEARLGSLRSSSVTVVETMAWLWGGFCCLLILLPLPSPTLPRFSLQLFALLNVLIALGGVVSRAVCESENRLRFWALLAIGAASARVFLGAGLASFEPWADSGLATFFIAGFVTLIPALRPHDVDWAGRLAAFRAVADRDFLLFAGATLSVLGGIYLFTNADRIIALGWPGIASSSGPEQVIGIEIRKVAFDQYQAAGLLGRSLLWGTQPLLWILFAQRTRLNRTDAASLTFFWIYLGALIGGALVLGVVTRPGSLRALGGPFASLGPDGPTFAAIMVPLGLLQGLGFFSLASRRYPECFALGGCSVVYAFVLLFFGRRPELMLPYMFGGGVISLMVVLFVGVVRWGRRQP
jgi:hypothetical protein